MTTRDRLLPYILLLLVFLSFTIPLVFQPATIVYSSHEGDERRYHYPTVLTFAAQFPQFHLASYESASAPLYYIFLASVVWVGGADIWTLRLINMAVSAICLLVLYGYLCRKGHTFKALICATIFMLSPSFWGPAVRLSTDNVALLFALLVIITIERNQSLRLGDSILSNVYISIAILSRQLYAWLIGVYLLFTIRSVVLRQSPGNLAKVLWPCLLPIGGLGYLVLLWKGLTPPLFNVHAAHAFYWDVPIYMFSLLGLYSSFFVFWLRDMYKEIRGGIFPMIVLIGIGICSLLIHPISFEFRRVGAISRGGMLWSASSYLPNLYSSSLAFWILFPVGLVCAYILIGFLISRKDYLMVSCFVLWTITNMVNTNVAQKYFEPFVLIFIAYTMMTHDKAKKHYWIGPVMLLTAFLAMTLISLVY